MTLQCVRYSDLIAVGADNGTEHVEHSSVPKEIEKEVSSFAKAIRPFHRIMVGKLCFQVRSVVLGGIYLKN